MKASSFFFTVLLFIPLLSFGNELSEPKELPIPPVITGGRIELNIQHGELKLPFGTSQTLGFNGSYLGPTIRVSAGELADISVNNRLDEDTTVHWHGLHVPAEFDGGPHQVIPAGGSWTPRIQIRQSAATLWYHPHLMGKTAEHVYRGLAGLFIIDDEYSESQDLPDEYGVNDIPLIIQDRRIGRDGSFEYRPARPDLMHGYTGNAVLVNGAYKPFLNLKQGTYRFRLLNGSNSSIYRISFSDSREFTVIASDGGFLPETVLTDSLIVSPGERYEILMDFKSDTVTEMLLDILGGGRHEILSITAGGETGKFFKHPESFNYEHPDYETRGLTMRTFNMETRGMGLFTINGRQMDMDRINFSLEKDTEEVWTIRNVGMGMMNIPHSFHVHDTQFTVLSINGQPPGPLYSGPKDTILLMAGDTAVIGVSFRDYTGIYMYHCHLLEHEDSGMIGQFMIE